MTGVAFFIGASLFLAAVIVGLHELKARYGLSLLYVFVGSTQYLQAVTAGSLFIPLPGGYDVSVGSAIVFSSSLFAILLVYVTEGAAETRNLVYGVLLANVSLTVLSGLIHVQLELGLAVDAGGLPSWLFVVNPRVLVAGTLTLLADAFLVAVLYELLFVRVRLLPLALRTTAALLAVLLFDSVVFSLSAFLGRPELLRVMGGHLVGKTLAGLVFGPVLAAYLALRRRGAGEPARNRDLRAVFSVLSYRRRYEELQTDYRRLWETGSDGLLVVDLESRRILDANPALAELVGCSTDEIRGRRIDEGQPLAAVATLLDRISASGSGRGRVEDIPLERFDGEVRRVEGIATVRNEDGTLLAHVNLRDATARIRAEEERRNVREILEQRVNERTSELRATNEKLQGEVADRKRAERAKDDFLAVISHELRTPLTSIRGAIGLLSGRFLLGAPPAAEELAGVALRNVERLMSLINELLDLSGLEEGRISFRREVIDARELVAASVTANRPYAGASNVSLVPAVVPDTDPLPIHGDEARLQQVLANLLSNAVKNSSDGGAVDVACGRSDGSVRIAVSDRGPGVPEAFRGRLFQKFQLADTTDSRRGGGAGLGLAISRAIVEGLGGQIGYEDRPEGGSVFWFALPLCPNPEHATPPVIAGDRAGIESAVER